MSDLFSLFKPFPELVARFSTRAEGDLYLRDGDALSLARREQFFASCSMPGSSVVAIKAAHAADVIRVGEREAGATMKHVDGLITVTEGIFLSVTAADCLAVYLYDPQAREVALLHAGWRGLARGIIAKALRQFDDPGRVRAVITPFIQACHFEVGAEVRDVFATHPEALIERDEKSFIDLGGVAFRQLLEAGVKSEYTEVSEECTACLPEKYFSYRRDGEPLATMVAVLGIRNH